MAGHAGEALKEMNARFSTFAKATSQVFGAFRSLTDSHPRTVCFQRALRNWWAVAIAVNQGCEDCIVFHLANASKHGASRQELVEVLGVAVEMGGGPGSVYAAKALAAFDDMASTSG